MSDPDLLAKAAQAVERTMIEWGNADSLRDMLEDIMANIFALEAESVDAARDGARGSAATGANTSSDVERMREALEKLANAADDVGVQFFDTETIAPEVEAMQAATQEARALLSERSAARSEHQSDSGACPHCEGLGFVCLTTSPCLHCNETGRSLKQEGGE